jgi:hypothetical protein
MTGDAPSSAHRYRMRSALFTFHFGLHGSPELPWTFQMSQGASTWFVFVR